MLGIDSTMRSIEEYFARYTGGRTLHSDDLSFVQIIIYNLHLKAPRPFELAAWRTHFGFDRHPSTFVVSGGEALANQASFKMIPGFLLLDKDQTVLFDATGHAPRHNLYTDLLPAAARLLRKEG